MAGPSNPVFKLIQKEFSQPWEIYTVLTSEVGGRPLATLHELQTIYGIVDLYDFLEILDVHNSVAEEHHKEAERKSAAQR